MGINPAIKVETESNKIKLLNGGEQRKEGRRGEDGGWKGGKGSC